MRINIYSQELTNQIALVHKDGLNAEGEPETFYGVRFYLVSAETLHHTEKDDDRSAVTFWLPKSETRKEALEVAFQTAALMVGTQRDM